MSGARRAGGRRRIVGRLGSMLLVGVAVAGCQAQIDAWPAEPGDTSRGLETTLSLASVAARRLGLTPPYSRRHGSPGSPMFSPPGGDPAGNAHGGGLPAAITVGGGSFSLPTADGSLPLRRHPDWIRAWILPGEGYHELKGPAPRPRPQHGLRRGPLLQHRGVLGPAHRHVHDPGRQVHPRLRVLRGEPAGRRFDDDDPPEQPRRSQPSTWVTWSTSVARDDLPDGGAHIFAETIRPVFRRACPGMGVEVLIPDFNGADERAADRHGGRPTSQPQPGDGGAPAEAVARARRGPHAGWLARPREIGPRDRTAHANRA